MRRLETLNPLEGQAMATESPSYLIGKAAILSGVTPANIRFYEKAGLLQAGERSSNTYRSYSDSDVHQLKFIRLCRTMDMSLEEVRSLLNLDLKKKADCAVANETLTAHITHVGERLAELRALQKDLENLRSRCDGAGSKCLIIEALHDRAEHLTRHRPKTRGHRHV
jgi:DNA-binding transcriptional MerR regulator